MPLQAWADSFTFVLRLAVPLTFVIPSNLLGQAIGYLSIIAGAMIWWLALTYVIAKMKDNFGIRGILYLNRSIGSIVICSSIVYAIMTLWNLWVR